MRFVRDLLGGVLIIIVAGALAIAQNALRKDGIRLLPNAGARDVGKQEVRPSSQADPGAGESPPPGSASEAANPAASATAEELDSGSISGDRLKTLLEGGGEGGIVLIDARPAQEYEAGHIVGAINIPYEKLADFYTQITEKVPFGAVIVCYCRSVSCDDSESLARELKFMGYRNVLLYKGGWDEWSDAGYPAVRPTPHNDKDE